MQASSSEDHSHGNNDNDASNAKAWQTQEHPIDPVVRAEIMQRIAHIEREHAVTVLFACESGSRGWGFASPDSDYDVRFIYAHRLDWYLRVSPQRDVIEQPVGAVFDVNGWELRKALGLLKKGNATLIEWLDSPVVYQADAQFLHEMQAAIAQVHQPERAHYHYINMARNNDRGYLHGDRVRLKKYLYVLRPLLACMWGEQQRSPPPMRFQTLVDALIDDAELKQAIAELLRLKRSAGEGEDGQPLPVIQHFMHTELERLQAAAPPVSHAVNFSVLDELLAHTVRRVNGLPAQGAPSS